MLQTVAFQAQKYLWVFRLFGFWFCLVGWDFCLVLACLWFWGGGFSLFGVKQKETHTKKKPKQTHTQHNSFTELKLNTDWTEEYLELGNADANRIMVAKHTFYLHGMKWVYAQIQLDQTVTTTQSQYAVSASSRAVIKVVYFSKKKVKMLKTFSNSQNCLRGKTDWIPKSD